MRLIGYTRVSTTDQESSLEQHAHRLLAAGARKVYCEVVGRLTDIDNRPALEEIFKLAELKEIDGVIVTRIDRLTALSGLWEKIVDHFNKYDVKLIGLDDSIDTESIIGQTMAGVQVVFNRAEVLRIRERVKRGIEHRRKLGKPNYPPFGFKVINDKYEFDTEPFLCLRTQRPKKDKEINGLSKYDIALDILDIFLEVKSITGACRVVQEKYGIQKTINKVKPKDEKYIVYTPENQPQQKRKTPLKTKTFKFSPEALRQWIINPVLQGHTRYNYKKGNSYLKEEEWVIIYNTHQPLINSNDYKQIQEIIDYNKKHKGYGLKSVRQGYTLSGLLKCEKCGYCLVLVNSKKTIAGEYTKRSYYYCNNNTCDIKGCLPAMKAEENIIKALCAKSEEIAKIARGEIIISSPELEKLRLQLNSLKSIPGDNPAINSAIINLEFQIENVSEKLKINHHQAKEKYDLIKIAGSEDYWKTLSIPLRREFFHALIDRVIVKGNRIIKIEFKL